jgi:hypothetical protein
VTDRDDTPRTPIDGDGLAGGTPEGKSPEERGVSQTNQVEKGEGYVKISLSEVDAEHEPGTDAALFAGYATVTPLRAVCEAWEVEVPAFSEGWLDRSYGVFGCSEWGMPLWGKASWFVALEICSQ